MTLALTSWIYRHDLDPFIVQFTEGIGLRWYGMAYVIGFFVGYWILRRYLLRNRVNLTPAQAGDFVLTVALSGVVGGRIGYVLLYGMEFFLRDPVYLFAVWEGGMSIHGGVVGAVIGIGWFACSREVNFWSLTDAASLGTPPGLFFGRIANFVNGELWGRTTDGSWGVIFPRAGPEPRHPSQLYEAVLEGPLLFGLLVLIARYTDEEGYLSAGFMTGYGIIRFFVEFYRAPDPHLGYELLGMTRGQEYSLVFVFVGILLLPSVRLYWLPSQLWEDNP